MKISYTNLVGSSVVLFGLSAHAAVVTYTFNETLNTQTTFSSTVSGLTLTLDNPNSNSGRFAADSDGLVLSSDSSQGPNSFQFKFSSGVSVVSYEIGFVLDGTAGSFTLSRTGASSTGNDLSSVGSFSINGLFTAGANESITLTSNPSGSPGWSQVKSLTVNTAVVPEPAEAVYFAGGACLIGAWIRRRNSAKA